MCRGLAAPLPGLELRSQKGGGALALCSQTARSWLVPGQEKRPAGCLQTWTQKELRGGGGEPWVCPGLVVDRTGIVLVCAGLAKRPSEQDGFGTR